MRSCSRPGEYRATSRHLLSASAWGSGGLAAWVEGCASGADVGGRAVGAACAWGPLGGPIVLLALEQRCPTAVRPLGHRCATAVPLALVPWDPAGTCASGGTTGSCSSGRGWPVGGQVPGGGCEIRTREGLHPTRFPTLLTCVYRGPGPSVNCASVFWVVGGERHRTAANETQTEPRRGSAACAPGACRKPIPQAGMWQATSHAFEDCAASSTYGRKWYL